MSIWEFLWYVSGPIAGWELGKWSMRWLRARKYGPANGRSLRDRLDMPYRYKCPVKDCGSSFASGNPALTAQLGEDHARIVHQELGL